jgi:hypothetical protein
MNSLIVFSLFVLLFLLALPTINQLVSCFRDAPELCEDNGARPGQVISRNIRIARTPSHSTHSNTL